VSGKANLLRLEQAFALTAHHLVSSVARVKALRTKEQTINLTLFSVDNGQILPIDITTLFFSSGEYQTLALLLLFTVPMVNK